MKFMLSFFLFGFLSVSVHSQSKKFNKQDSIKLGFCNCDSLYKSWPPKPGGNVEVPEYDGNGWNRLYNFQNNIGQCGYFNKFYFMYGLQLKYDDNGKLIKINKFYNGKLIGICGKK